MLQRSKIYIYTGVAFLVIFSLYYLPLTAHAAGQNAGDLPVLTSLTFKDLDGDGTIDAAVMTGSFLNNLPSTITVYDPNGITDTHDWQHATNFDRDIWVFDAGNKGTASLIIRFSVEGELHKAEIYDDRDGDGLVRYALKGKNLEILEAATPHIVVTANGPWTYTDGSLNYNLDFVIDGYVGVDAFIVPVIQKLLIWDGRPDFDLKITEAPDGSHIPDHFVFRLLHPSDSINTLVRVNTAHHRPLPVSQATFWPLFTVLQPGNYFDTPPTVAVDWAHSKITFVGMGGYPIEEGFHINSLAPLSPAKINVLDFENPMSYYDIANDHDGFPELFTRVLYYPPHDQSLLAGLYGKPLEQITYSWNQTNDPALHWDYSLSLVGHHLLPDVINIDNNQITTVNHDKLPAWVIGNEWDAASFVEETVNKPASSEGIYEWSTLEGVQADSEKTTPDEVLGSSNEAQLRYFTGITTTTPITYYNDIRPYWHAEYTPELGGQPKLYISSIDHKLHLLYMRTGLWNLDRGRRVDLKRIGDDPYVNQWQVSVAAKVESELDLGTDYLILAQGNNLVLKQVNIPPVIDTLKPPTNNAEWVDFGQRRNSTLFSLVPSSGDPSHLIPQSKPTALAPDDLKGMFDQFGGTVSVLNDARISAFRPTTDGFRFLLAAGQNYVAGPQTPDPLNVPGAGTYIVLYHQNTHDFQVSPLLPAQLQVVPGTLKASQPQATTLHTLDFTLLVQNPTLSDGADFPIYFTAINPQGEHFSIGTVHTDLLAGAQNQIKFDWSPPSTGIWQIIASLAPSASGDASQRQALTLNVVANPQPTFDWSLSLMSNPFLGLSIPGCLIILLLLVISRVVRRFMLTNNAFPVADD